MAKKIEIYENTLLKLLVRRGTDADRKNVTLSEGELGYTVDTKKLYIGDGQTIGGVPAGGVSFLGTYPLPYNQLATTFTGDLIFAGGNNTLYTYVGPDWREESSWKAIGGIYTEGDNTITIDSFTNQIKVGALSAGNISTNALGSGLTLDPSNKIALSDTINVDEISTKNFNSVTLPQKFNYKIGTGTSTTYTLPDNGGAGFLYSDVAGNLNWRDSPGGETLFVSGSAIVPVGTIMPFPSTNTTNIPYGWIACLGQSVAQSEYPELAQIIGNVIAGNFVIPDLRNKTIYGTQTPQTATLYPMASGTGDQAPISAKGMVYIIKALPDNVANVDMELTYPLVATVNGTEIQNKESFSPLDGSVKIEFDTSGSLGFRNKAINGNFDFWQRRTQTLNVPVSNIPTFTTNGTRTSMTADRWLTYALGPPNARGEFSVTRENNNRINFPIDPEEGDDFQLNGNYFLRLSYQNGVGTYRDGTNLYDSLSSLDGLLCTQVIENASEVLGKRMTLSFWAKASKNTYIFSESQIFTPGIMNTPANCSDLMLLTTEWQLFTHTYTMPTFAQVSAFAYNANGITTVGGRYPERPAYTSLGSSGLLPPLSSWMYQIDIKTHWSKGSLIVAGHSISATANGFNYFYPGSGTELDYPIGNFMTMPVLSTLCTNVLSGTPDGGFYDIAQVQLEVGKGPTPFEHRPQQIELALCQRYFEKSYDVEIPPGTLNTNATLHQFGNYGNAANTYFVSFPVSFKTNKAKVPAIQIYSPSSGLTGRFYKASPGTATDVINTLASSVNTHGFHTASITVTTPGNHYQSWVADAEFL